MVLFLGITNAQTGNIINRLISAEPSHQLGDSFWIAQKTLKLVDRTTGKEFDSSAYKLVNTTLLIDTSIIKDSFWLTYRSFPFEVNSYFFTFDSVEHHQPIPPEYSLLNKQFKNQDWWEKSGVEYSGNYTRGLSVGNNQSLILNSALNLQLIGDLGDGLKITGAITDNQIPIQPEGNTRQIQEFDRLYLELKKNKTSLVIGDFDLQKPQGYFQNYFKKSLGGLVTQAHNFKGAELTHSASVGISKGKFNRMTIPIVNANQGPYRLRGRDGENFIILLAGSEKVFLDGVLMSRGDDADYIMDYNLAELRFTARRLVTDQMRLIVEFEYTDQNYLRSLMTYKLNVQKGDWNSYLNYYQENDSKKPSVNNDLDSLEQLVLSQSGDVPDAATSSRVSRAGTSYRPDRVYYIAKDTNVTIMGNTVTKQYFVHLEKSDSNSLQIIFTEIGFNKGEYQLVQSNVNGRVYKWVGVDPISGVPLGTYAPYRILVAPRNHQLLSIGIKYKSPLENKPYLWMESTISNLDKNRLSEINDEDNLGYAGILHAGLPVIKWNKAIFKNSASYEYNNKRFFALNPYRNAEFNRDWNIESQTGFNDQLLTVRSETNIGKKIKSEFQFNHFNRQNIYTGNKYLVGLNRKDSLSELNVKFDFLQSKQNPQSSTFMRPGIKYERQVLRYFTLGAGYEQEKNARKNSVIDSLYSSSFDFTVYSSFVRFQKSENRSFQLDWRRRNDNMPTQKEFEAFSISDEFGINGIIQNTKSGNWRLDFTVRNIEYSRKSLQDSIGQYYFLGQLDHSISILKNAIRIKNIYSLQSGAEPRVEFVYEERRPGDGDYIFIDFNKDGIRQSGEYVFAPDIDTARYVKIQLFNSEYFQTYQSAFNSVFNIDFGKFYKKETKSPLSKISYESIIRLSNKITPNSTALEKINPFSVQANNSNIIAFQKGLNQQVFFNRANPKYEFSLQFTENANKILLISGIESRDRKDLMGKARLTIKNRLDFLFSTGIQEDKRNTEFYALQNYKIQSTPAELSAVFRITRDVRIQIGSKYKKSEELLQRLESSEIAEFFQKSQLSFSKKFSGRLEFRYININYTGQAGSAIEYVMLDGLKDGNNFTGEFIIDWRLSSIMFAQFSYSLRKASGQIPLNTGRASLRANF
ncbi:MAG: hypothetical protein HOP11_02755 [Saprospiraceae bacterium]|nr:hypothetical protein [Saprospiraceae bacterium]